MDHPQYTVVWSPQPGPQTALITCPIYEVLFGGARGGGKTDGMLGEWAVHSDRCGKYSAGIMFRRTRRELYDTIERSKQLYGPLGAVYHEQDSYWRMPNGSRLLFAYLERDSDAEGYQGHSYTRVYGEEIGNFPNEAPVRKMHAVLRSPHGIPVGFRATANPGGPGHQWVKARYIDPAPSGMKVLTDPETGLERVYIPSRVGDNLLLDPQYVSQLKMSGTKELVRAWLEGDWSVIAGAFFPEFTADRHIVRPFEIPEDWPRYRAMDWGSAKPFCVLWIAISDGSMPEYPRNSLIVYREWYGSDGTPNVGIKMPAELVGAKIAALEKGEKTQAGFNVLDPAGFSSDGGPSIAERLLHGGAQFRKADNARVARNGAMGGWDQLRARLIGEEDRPMLYVLDTCTHLIRTLPALQHDQIRPEDVDSEGEDHAPDALRYACMARPWLPTKPSIPEPKYPIHRTIDELIRAARNKRLAED
jgi:hypothetical protein